MPFWPNPDSPLPMSSPQKRIERIFAKHGNLFAGGAIYSTAVMVWAFLGQVLNDGKEASCQAAVACVVSYCLVRVSRLRHRRLLLSGAGGAIRSSLRDLTREVAAEVKSKPSAWL